MFNRFRRTVCPMLLAACMLAMLAGCFSPKGDINLGYQPTPRPVAGNIPPGPAHDICRQEMGNAIARIDKLQHDLDKCKAERDRFKAERDSYRKQLGQ